LKIGKGGNGRGKYGANVGKNTLKATILVLKQKSAVQWEDVEERKWKTSERR